MAHDEITQRRARSFDSLAEDYDTYRPGYPEELVIEVVDYAGRAVEHGVLEIGAGTGKATLAFAAEGLQITALEPGEPMAEVLHRRLAESSIADRVTVRIGVFEDFDESDGPFGLIYSAQAFHWTDPATRWPRLHSLLSPGGAAALFWNHWELDSGAHDVTAVRDLYAGYGPQVRPDLGEVEGEAERDSELQTLQHGGFTDIDERTFTWQRSLETSAYLALLATTSQYAILPDDTRTGLLGALDGILGPTTQLRGSTYLQLARRA